jgi:hypothetical protein
LKGSHFSACLRRKQRQRARKSLTNPSDSMHFKGKGILLCLKFLIFPNHKKQRSRKTHNLYQCGPRPANGIQMPSILWKTWYFILQVFNGMKWNYMQLARAGDLLEAILTNYVSQNCCNHINTNYYFSI